MSTFFIICILLIVVYLQYTASNQLWAKVKTLKFIFDSGNPKFYAYSLNTVGPVPDSFLDSNQIDALVTDNAKKIKSILKDDLSSKEGSASKLSLLQTSGNNKAAHRIMENLNAYLIRNRGSAPDFSILRDITDRNTEVLVSEIEQSLPLPLYYGLAGTLVSAVIGLLALGSGFNTLSGQEISGFTESTGSLVIHVALAMIASAVGIVFTAYNSNYCFKPALAKMEADRNQFLSFLQAELLPHMSVTANAALQKLQEALKGFNNSFTSNLSRLEKAFDTTVSLSKLQADTAEAFANIDADKMAASAEAMAKAVRSVGRFVTALESTEQWLTASQALTQRVELLLDRTDHVGKTVKALESGVAGVHALNQTIVPHLETLALVGEKVHAGFKQEVETATSQYTSFITENLIPNNTKAAQTFSQEIKATSDIVAGSLVSFRDQLLAQQRALEEALKTEKSSLTNLKKLNDVDATLQSILLTLQSQNSNAGQARGFHGLAPTQRGPINRFFIRMHLWLQKL